MPTGAPPAHRWASRSADPVGYIWTNAVAPRRALYSSMQPPIPPDLRRFILTSIPSVPFLEAMLLLRGDARLVWDAPELARRLYVPPVRAAELLRQLGAAGFIVAAEVPDGWCWRPPAEAGALVDNLAAHYAENLVGVTELIHAREASRATQFADAFRWKKEP
jgi:hypothetical protein